MVKDMAAVKKVPMRQCVGCGEKRPKKELLRIVKPENEEASVDRSGRKNGRGAYICPQVSCLEAAVRKKALDRSLKTQITEETLEALKKELA